MTPAITVGIPTYCGAENGEEDLLGFCLGAIRLRTCSDLPYEIVVVDDSGKPWHQERSRAVAEKHGARFLAHPENRGVAAGWNTLTRAAEAPLVALLNDDFYVSPGWLDALAYALRENPGAGSMGLFAFFCNEGDVPWLLDGPDASVTPVDFYTKAPAPEEAEKHTGREQPGRCMAPPGCGFGFQKEVWERVAQAHGREGGFDESLGKAFHEESMFGADCAALGMPAYALQWPHCYTIMSATFRRRPDWTRGVGDLIARPRRRFVEKWAQRLPHVADEMRAALAKGERETYPVHRELMGKIPFPRGRWLDPDGPRDELITGEEGYHA